MTKLHEILHLPVDESTNYDFLINIQKFKMVSLLMADSKDKIVNISHKYEQNNLKLYNSVFPDDW